MTSGMRRKRYLGNGKNPAVSACYPIEMGWFPAKTDPGKLIKFVILFCCGVFTITQLEECIVKLTRPPISTHYQYSLNETIKYPTLTICRRPPYKKHLFTNYGLRENANLEAVNAFQRFLFANYTLSEFMEAVTYRWEEVVGAYAFAGTGSNPNLSISWFYHLSKGKCYVIEPLVLSDKFSVSGGYVLFLKHETSTKVQDEDGLNTYGFPLFLHDASEILMYQDEQKDSFMDSLYVESSEDVSVILDTREYHKIPSWESPCLIDSNYSKSKCLEVCIHKQVALASNCTVPWLVLTKSLNLSECDTYDSVKNLLYYFRNKRSEYQQNCDCPTSCNLTLYSTKIVNRKDIDELNAPNSSVTIYYSNNLVSSMREIAGYDWNQFVSDVGGSLGFLLGLSVLSIICLVEEICQLFIKWMFNRKMKKQEARERKEKLNGKNKEASSNECEDEKNNALKKEEAPDISNQTIADKHDYKYMKDFTTDYHYYENNLFGGKEEDTSKKY